MGQKIFWHTRADGTGNFDSLNRHEPECKWCQKRDAEDSEAETRWLALPDAAKQECRRMDHGSFVCPHHATQHPPAIAFEQAKDK